MSLLITLYPYALTVHITTTVVLLSTVVVSDFLAFLWARGSIERLSLRVMTILHRLVWIGLGFMLVSGGILFYPNREYLVTDPAFLMKMVFVATLIVNGAFISRHYRIATTTDAASLPPTQKRVLFISGGVSTSAWIGAFVAAQLIGA